MKDRMWWVLRHCAWYPRSLLCEYHNQGHHWIYSVGPYGGGVLCEISMRFIGHISMKPALRILSSLCSFVLWSLLRDIYAHHRAYPLWNLLLLYGYHHQVYWIYPVLLYGVCCETPMHFIMINIRDADFKKRMKAEPTPQYQELEDGYYWRSNIGNTKNEWSLLLSFESYLSHVQ